MRKIYRGRRRPGGFTLIELMAVIAVIGVLAMIAIPSFMEAVRKGRRSDAFTALSAVQQAQERWRGNRSSYTDSLTPRPSDDPPGLGLPATSANGYYAITIDAADAAGYTATAAAVAGTTQAADGNCRRLRVRVTGGNIAYGSSDGAGDFDESGSNRCWAR
ncbi:MAG: prepilin-type N-terminal cleavage/methylation domain-containing protein [Rubrivivax sp.]|nr:prepilin-type N-terminal cleavage/methylation domain-containing protein [Rubrivivax sp.]